MNPKNIIRIMRLGGWISLAFGIGCLMYVVYAIVVGRVIVGSRAHGDTTIDVSSGAPYLIGLGIYSFGALMFLFISRSLLKSGPVSEEV